MANRELNLKVTTNKQKGFTDAEYFVIATPTDYDPVINYFNTGLVEAVIRDVQNVNLDAIMIIKSTIPVKYAQKLIGITECKNLIFSPKFCVKAKPCRQPLFIAHHRQGTI